MAETCADMNILILAAGYGTRLNKDVEAAGSQYAHLKGLPKPLLPIDGQPLLTRWMRVFKNGNNNLRFNIFIVINDYYKVIHIFIK